jgi:ubiquinone biosynthesis monooxygenase Coq7
MGEGRQSRGKGPPNTYNVRVHPPTRQFSLADRLIQELDRGLRTVAAANVAARPNPAGATAETIEDPAARRKAAALMRVNHAGEIAAQALYHGQALTARNVAVRQSLLDAAQDETDHLAWCEQRVRELDGRTSLLAPLWYAGSFAIGALAGLAGDRSSLGFVAETEKQVVEHLDSHTHELPEGDERSRLIVAQMRADEDRHGSDARNAGALDLPRPIRNLMRRTARVMTRTAYRL